MRAQVLLSYKEARIKREYVPCTISGGSPGTLAETKQMNHNWVNGILLPKLVWPTVRKKCSSDQEKLLKFEAEGPEFANILRSLEQSIQTVKGQNNLWW